jgi:hypothetical protein
MRSDESIQTLIGGLKEHSRIDGGVSYTIGSVGQAIDSALEEARKLPLREHGLLTETGWIVFHLEGAKAVLDKFAEMQREAARKED